MIIEYFFSLRMSLESLYNHLQSENVIQIRVMVRLKTIFDIKRRFR